MKKSQTAKKSTSKAQSCSHLLNLYLDKSVGIIYMTRVTQDRRKICQQVNLPLVVIDEVLQRKDHIMKIRRYLPDQQRYLTPQELNDVIAITEILREFVRRAIRLGNEVSDGELVENVEALKRLFKVEKMEISTKWLPQFRENSKFCMSALTDFGVPRREVDVQSLLEHLQPTLDAGTVSRFLDRLRSCGERAVSLKSHSAKSPSGVNRKMSQERDLKIVKINKLRKLEGSNESSLESTPNTSTSIINLISDDEESSSATSDDVVLFEDDTPEDVEVSTADTAATVEMMADDAPTNVQSSEPPSRPSSTEGWSAPEAIVNEEDDSVQSQSKSCDLSGGDQVQDANKEPDRRKSFVADSSTNKTFLTRIESEHMSLKMLSSDPIIISYLKMAQSTGASTYNETILRINLNNFMEMKHSLFKRITNLYRVLLLLHYSNTNSSPEDLNMIMPCFTVSRIRVYLKNYGTYLKNWRIFLNEYVCPIIFTDAYYEILSEYCRRHALVRGTITDEEKTQMSWEVKNFLRYTYKTSLETINSMLNISKGRIPVSLDLNLMTICTDLQDRLNPMVMENIKCWYNREQSTSAAQVPGESEERTFAQHSDLRTGEVEPNPSIETTAVNTQESEDLREDEVLEEEIVVYKVVDDETEDGQQELELDKPKTANEEGNIENNQALYRSMAIIDMAKGNPDGRQIRDKANPSLPMIDDVLQCMDHISRIRRFVPDQQQFLTPQELNDVIAITEILREFVRRAIRLGNEVSDGELVENVEALKRLFKVEKMEISTKWLPQFRENSKFCMSALTDFGVPRREVDVQSLLEHLRPTLDAGTVSRFLDRLRSCGEDMVSLKCHPKKIQFRQVAPTRPGCRSSVETSRAKRKSCQAIVTETSIEANPNPTIADSPGNSKRRKLNPCVRLKREKPTNATDKDEEVVVVDERRGDNMDPEKPGKATVLESKAASKDRPKGAADEGPDSCLVIDTYKNKLGFLQSNTVDELNIKMIALDPIILSYLHTLGSTGSTKYNDTILRLSIKNFMTRDAQVFSRTLDLYRILLLLHYSTRHSSIEDLSRIMTCFTKSQIEIYMKTYYVSFKIWHSFLEQRLIPTLLVDAYYQILCEYCRRYMQVHGGISEDVKIATSREVMHFLRIHVDTSWRTFDAMFNIPKRRTPRSEDLSLVAICKDLQDSLGHGHKVMDTLKLYNLNRQFQESLRAQPRRAPGTPVASVKARCNLSIARVESLHSTEPVESNEKADVIDIGASSRPEQEASGQEDIDLTVNDDEDEEVVVYKILEEFGEFPTQGAGPPEEAVDEVPDDTLEEPQLPRFAGQEENKLLDNTILDLDQSRKKATVDVNKVGGDEVEESEKLDADPWPEDEISVEVYEVVDDDTDDDTEEPELPRCEELEENEHPDEDKTRKRSCDVNKVRENEVGASEEMAVDQCTDKIDVYEVVEDEFGAIEKMAPGELTKPKTQESSQQIEFDATDVNAAETDDDDDDDDDALLNIHDLEDPADRGLSDSQCVKKEVMQMIHNLEMEMQKLVRIARDPPSQRCPKRLAITREASDPMAVSGGDAATTNPGTDVGSRLELETVAGATPSTSPPWPRIKQEPAEGESDNSKGQGRGRGQGAAPGHLKVSTPEARDPRFRARIKEEPGLDCAELATPSFPSPPAITDYRSALKYLIALKIFVRKNWNTEAIRILDQLEDIFEYYKDALS